MKKNTITWCTDGSYHRKHTPNVSGAGRMAYCTKTNNHMTGSFCEISEDAGSYRGNQLGLCAIHHLIKTLYNFYNTHDWHTTINCDNEGAIKISKKEPEKNPARMQLRQYLEEPEEHKENI